METSVIVDENAKIAMTLAAIAYAKGRDAIATQLANKDYATGGEWELAWGPDCKESNQMYFAKQVTEGLYGVAIRGSLTNFPSAAFFENWYEDLDVLHQEKWPYPIEYEHRDATIARGTAIGLDHLTTMSDDGETILDYIKNNVLPKGGNILVTGHSLGACLTTVFSLWLHYQLREVSGGKNVKILPYTFAAPSAGNQAFANCYNETFKESWRYYNTIDVVPKAWADIPSIKKLYDEPGPKCPEDIKLAVDATDAALKGTEWWDDSYYTQTNGLGSPLRGTPNPTSDFFAEIGDQHAANNYLRLLGAPAVTL